VTRLSSAGTAIDIEGGRYLLRRKLAAMSRQELHSVTRAEMLGRGPIADLIAPEL
jgi:3-oxoadipate CoA-transferase beta subunit